MSYSLISNQTYNRKEFTANSFKAILNQHNVRQSLVSINEMKSKQAYIERFKRINYHRDIQLSIWQYKALFSYYYWKKMRCVIESLSVLVSFYSAIAVAAYYAPHRRFLALALIVIINLLSTVAIPTHLIVVRCYLVMATIFHSFRLVELLIQQRRNYDL
jgi:fumarate reductase subunit C